MTCDGLSVRDDYAPRFGRQVLSIWRPPFASTYVGEAVALPRGDGYMVTLEYGRGRIRVTCPAPRTDANYRDVDAAIVAAVREVTA